MVRPTDAVTQALRPLVDERDLDAELSAKRPDLTQLLLRAASEHAELPRPLVAAVTRAACGLLGKRFGGHAIELRVPPQTAAHARHPA